MKSDSTNELAKALSAAQSEFSSAAKNKVNPFFKSHYADLNSVWDACRGPLNRHGLSIVQTTDVEDGKNVLVTILMHSSGQWIEGRYAIAAKTQDPQAVGSAITYARRYALASMVGIVSDEDDDGEAAQARPSEQPKPQLVKQPVAVHSAKPTGFAQPSKNEFEEMCPECGAPGRKSKPEYGGGYYCSRNKEGCKTRWQ
jgi:endogenous inhibitor of DNA gyrase (YacG/DUF329 family)